MFPPRPLPEGSLVILKSGGPLMTSERGNGKDLVSCLWFEGPTLQRDVFHYDALVIVGLPYPLGDVAELNNAADKREAAAKRSEADRREPSDHEAS